MHYFTAPSAVFDWICALQVFIAIIIIIIKLPKESLKKITKIPNESLPPFSLMYTRRLTKKKHSQLELIGLETRALAQGEEGVRNWTKSLTLTKTRLTHIIRGKSGFRGENIAKKTVRLGNGWNPNENKPLRSGILTSGFESPRVESKTAEAKSNFNIYISTHTI